MEARPRTLNRYIAPNGEDPFQGWLDGLNDLKGGSRILVRLNRVEQGNFGPSGPVGGGVFELKFDFGPGYRVYYGLDGDDVVILLGGGDKKTQSSDIRKAIARWKVYNA